MISRIAIDAGVCGSGWSRLQRLRKQDDAENTWRGQLLRAERLAGGGGCGENTPSYELISGEIKAA
jgi:hypothetical protein